MRKLKLKRGYNFMLLKSHHFLYLMQDYLTPKPMLPTTNLCCKLGRRVFVAGWFITYKPKGGLDE